MSGEPLPCPFCACLNTWVTCHQFEHFVVCNECQAQGPKCKTSEEAVRRWDNRVGVKVLAPSNTCRDCGISFSSIYHEGYNQVEKNGRCAKCSSRADDLSDL